jgi:regulator of replication initiation timing
MSRLQPVSIATHALDAPRLTPRNRSAYSAIENPMASDFSELAGLEQKLATLLADYVRLRAENESLKRELGRSMEQNRSLNSRIAAASARLDSLLQQLPESTS